MSNQWTDVAVTITKQASMAEQHLCQQKERVARASQARSHVKPLVTLAVPTLNRSDYISETLSSVLTQEYSNLDILVSDNGSRDETPARVQALISNDRRARFRRNDTTVPMHKHFTQCVQAAWGEFFILLCDDDRINSRFVSELIAVAMRHPDVNVVVPANVSIDEHGIVIEDCAKLEGEVFDGPEFVCHWLYGRAPKLFVDATTVLVRTDVLRRFGGYQGFAGARNNDNLLFLQCAITGRVGFAKAAVFYWRVHSSSYGSNVTVQQIAESSRQFLHHLRSDSCTVQALAALPVARRKQIFNGVRLMTAIELLYYVKFHENPFRWKCLRTLFLYRWDAAFFFIVLRQSYRKLRQCVRSIRERTSLWRIGG